VTNLIEAHTHADLMPYEAYEELALKGVNRIITHSCYVGATRATTLFDHYHQLLKIFTNNAQKNGLKLFITDFLRKRNYYWFRRSWPSF